MFFMSFGSGGLCMACLVVCGFLGLFVFGLPGSGFCLGLGWAMWSGFLGFVLALLWLALVLGLVGVLLVLFGEFDPGSGRTLAACLTHASRTVKRLPFWWVWMSGERVSNT